ncbi:MAG: MFS transporter [Candidatus Sphingomonas phytovorans]|nr:MFS transporter [Sphingomonas sp.]WEK00122.1 MAG: MFS transporter [Sphingomonas sp.]
MPFPLLSSLAGRPRDGHRAVGFLLIYAIAHVGGVMGYLPLLSLLLPMKIEAVAGDARLGVFTATVTSGAIAASLSSILFGWLSDGSVAAGKGRRKWVAGGLVATAMSYALIDAASTPCAIIVATIVFQTALNAMLGPLAAIMADEIPDAQKGFTGGLLALANPSASAVLAIVVSVGTLGQAAQLAIVVLAIAVCVTPLLFARARPVPIVIEPGRLAISQRHDLAAAWGARLFMQIAGVVLSLYLLYYFESVTPNEPHRDLALRVGHLLTISFILPLPIAVLAGRLSDRLDRRKPFLVAAAVVAAIGLLGMAFARDWGTGALAFGVYAVGSGVFLPLHAAFSMQLLPDPQHRGRDLGLINLTNTLPSLLGPLLTWWLATPHDFSAVMLALVVLTLCGGLCVLGVRGRR